MAVGASQALAKNARSSPKLPEIPALKALYEYGCHPRAGETIMIAGRPGAMKSLFALWLVHNWGLDTLYLSADMSGFQASARLASHLTQRTVDEIERDFAEGEADYAIEALQESKVRFSFRSPIRWEEVTDEINAWVTLYNRYPECVVVDNLMDVDGSEADYQAQMFAMQVLSDLSRETGATIVILHHATEGSWSEGTKPHLPPARREIKNKLGEKPEQTFTVSVNGTAMLNGLLDFHLAVVKQRMGRSDPAAQDYLTFSVDPERSTFYPRNEGDIKIGDLDNGAS